jgi:gamma-glutamylcyclotransferase (GGCT)/AIG2-like uncharacterized protein YtfP
MIEYLFAYGTLRPGLAPESMAAVVGRLELIGEGFVCGVLYDFGEFPGAVLDGDSGSRIAGTVYRLPDEISILEELDAYEGFEPDSADASLFLRVDHVVNLADGGTLACWLYVINRPVDGKPMLSQWPA